MKATTNAINSPRHGGDLNVAIQQYGGEKHDWIDLSTGISPWSYPIPSIDSELWRELPNANTALEQSAAEYYQVDNDKICVTPGSQLAIRILPTLLKLQSIAIPSIGYQEHRYAWQNAGHSIVLYQDLAELDYLITSNAVKSAVVINPNNPTNECLSYDAILKMANNLSGLLVVDEAFADLDNRHSVSSNTQVRNLVVIRSIGKFFGLAGARIGFLIGHHSAVKQLKALFTPWSINAPAQYIAQNALNDTQWQAQQRHRIKQHSAQLKSALEATIQSHKLDLDCRSNGLFTSLFGLHSSIERLHHHLAQDRIWTRIGDPFINKVLTQHQQQNWLRLSLPGDDFPQLQNTLNAL